MSGVATFIRPMSARTRTTPERRLMLIGMSLDDLGNNFIAVEEDGLISRFLFSEVSVDWRYDEYSDDWMDLHPTNEEAALEADAGAT
jgi:hypothetical protein